MTTEQDSFEDDPFFKLVPDGQWNACIGRQGGRENYLDGYIEAAIELANTVIDKQLLGQRDTLVLPILYNARHAVELTLKYAIDTLAQAGIIKDGGLHRSHDVKALWDHVNESAVADEQFRSSVAALRPFIDSLAGIDDDGQALRYHSNVDGEASLDRYAVANLRLIRASLDDLKRHVSAIKSRAIDLVDEYRSGSVTDACSRSDLFAIAALLPPRDQWKTGAFDEKKDLVKQRFDLTNRKFSDALNKLQELRETKSIIGVETDLVHLTDDCVISAVEHWRTLHPKRKMKSDDLSEHIVNGSDIGVEELLEHTEKLGVGIAAWQDLLSAEQFAELQSLFYLGRDRLYAEYYEARVSRTIKEHEGISDKKEAVAHLLNKTNFLSMVESAARRVGRLNLAEKLSAM